MNKKKEVTRGVKFILFSISAGVIEFASFALLDGLTQWLYWPEIPDRPHSVCALEFYTGPAVYLPFRRKRADSLVEGRPLLCRIHTGFDHSGKLSG